MKTTVIPAGRSFGTKPERGDWVKLTDFEKHLLRTALRETADRHPELVLASGPWLDLLEKLQ